MLDSTKIKNGGGANDKSLATLPANPAHTLDSSATSLKSTLHSTQANPALDSIPDSNLITNEGANTLFARLSELFKTYTSTESKLDLWVISGFFNAKALQAIAQNFAPRLNSLHIIIGQTAPSQDKSFSITFALCDPFDLKVRDFEHQLDSLTTHQDALAFLHSHNVKIYTLKTRNILIHSKLYLLHRAGDNITQSFAIIGSSNLTASGLGLYNDNSNKELNLLCDSRKDTAHALKYFENLRAQCSDVSQEVRENLKSSFFYHAPADVLHKLISLLPKDLEALKSSEEDTLNIAKEVFGLYDFQLIAAKELYKRLKAYNIAFLGDPVGAGKTLSALGVAALYKRVVIIAPKNLKTQWQSYLSLESYPDICDTTHKSAHQEFIATLPYKIHILSYHEATHPNDEQKQKLLSADLVVLDESHNFRNGAPKGSTKKDKPNQYTRLRDNLNKDSALLALSATIINNSLLDFANQIALAKDSLTIQNTRISPLATCHQAQTALSEQKPLPYEYGYLTSLIFSRSSEEIVAELKKLDKDMPTPRIECQHLSSIPSNIDFSYARLLEILGIGDQQDPQESDGRSKGITFSIYDPYGYLPKNVRDIVKEAHLENLGEYTTPKGFICMSLLKSLESSVDAFLTILGKIIAYHEYYLKSIAKAHSAQNSDESQANDIISDESDELDSTLLPTRLQNLANLNYLKHLPQSFNDTIASDLDKLCKIQATFTHYKPDSDFAKCAKFQALCAFIDSIPNITAQKLLVFTESIPTAKAIAHALKKHYTALEIATISGADSLKDFIATKQAFSPISQHYSLKASERAIDILIATDVLSEGQNLQDCANLINWDIAFNPVRSIQRIGRIHRISSSHKAIRIAHFFPDIDIDSYIKLEERLRYKLKASSHTTHTSDPFATMQECAKEEHFQKYRQLVDNELNAFENTTATNLLAPLPTCSNLSPMSYKAHQAHCPMGFSLSLISQA